MRWLLVAGELSLRAINILSCRTDVKAVTVCRRYLLRAYHSSTYTLMHANSVAHTKLMCRATMRMRLEEEGIGGSNLKVATSE